ncbi:MAG: NAD(P)H-quinone oxidoreductase [Ectothiorhodospiraceae bacterium]|nr:NAD(P)H-quinone oxidoreductase [Ectothiorhodospiraceae bacterium]
MRVVEVTEPGGPEVMRIARRPLPVPAPHEVLVRVAATAVNGPDIVQRKGQYPPPKGASDLLGLEISGEVVARGEAVSAWEVGDTICALTNGGGYAEFCTVHAGHCLPIPDGVAVDEAASLPETYFTVWSNIFLPGRLSAGQTLLVHGGAGGIGSTAIQLGKAFGAKVLATEGSPERCAFCVEMGADRAIDYQHEDFVEVARAEGGVDVVLDIIGGPYFERNIKACRHDATIVQLAFNAGARVDTSLMPIMLKRLTYTGSTLRSRPDAFKTRVADELRAQVWPLLATGVLRPVVRSRYPLEQVQTAHARMEAASHTGKILLVP